VNIQFRIQSHDAGGEQEYLTTSYRPDWEFLDGVLLDRNVWTAGPQPRPTQSCCWFDRRQPSLEVFPELRIAVGPKRYRVPDVYVVKLPAPTEQVLTNPPYICIEVLSPEDTLPRLQERLDDYLAMGVNNIWVMDPTSRQAWHVTRQGHLEVLDGMLRTSDGEITLPIEDLFS
jgi:hypothetical protein